MPVYTDDTTDLTIPTYTLPDRNVEWTDPVFGTRHLRVTDADSDPSGGSPSYSYWRVFSNNNKWIWNSLSANVIPFDPEDFSVGTPVYVGDDIIAGSNLVEDATWSWINEDEIYYRATTAHIKKLNVSTLVDSNVVDLVAYKAANFPDADRHFQMHWSVDMNRVSMTWTDAGSPVGYTVWDVSENAAIYTDTTTTGLDEVHIDKSGRYLIVKYGGTEDTEIIDLDAEPQTVTTLDGETDLSIGHSDCGSNFVVHASGWAAVLTARTLSSPFTRYTVWDPTGGWDFYDIHLSMTRIVDNNFILASNMGADPAFAVENEIFILKTDGSEDIYRFAHTQNAGTAYENSPWANWSADGRFVAWNCNWKNASGRRELLIAEIPESIGTWQTPSAPSGTPASIGGVPCTVGGVLAVIG